MERSNGFPSMVAMLEQLDEKEDAALARRMKRKKHPALKSAETVPVEASDAEAPSAISAWHDPLSSTTKSSLLPSRPARRGIR